MSSNLENARLTERMARWLRTSQAEVFPYDVSVGDQTFTVFEGVFSPAYYSETEFFATQIARRVRPGTKYLDLGCGIGVSAILGAKAGASVVALDLNPTAVANTLHNAERAGVEIDVRVSNIFSALHDAEKFGLIFWNIPFAFRDRGTELALLEEAIFDPGYEKNLTFLSQGPNYLEDGGEMLLGVSSTLGSMERLSANALACGLALTTVASSTEVGPEEPTMLQLLRASAASVLPKA